MDHNVYENMTLVNSNVKVDNFYNNIWMSEGKSSFERLIKIIKLLLDWLKHKFVIIWSFDTRLVHNSGGKYTECKLLRHLRSNNLNEEKKAALKMYN